MIMTARAQRLSEGIPRKRSQKRLKRKLWVPRAIRWPTKSYSDDSSLFKCTKNPRKLLGMKKLKELNKIACKQAVDETPQVVDIQVAKSPRPLLKRRPTQSSLVLNSAPQEETHKLNKAMHLVNQTQVAKESPHSPDHCYLVLPSQPSLTSYSHAS